MSIFGTILSKIVDYAHAATGSAATPAATPDPAAATAAAPVAPSAAATAPAVDVDAVLTDLAAKNPQKLNWQQSIVDLLKLLDLDSSLDSRKKLAEELHYTGDTNDSATMNIWLHKQVMIKLAENGGKVSDDLKA